MPSELALLAGHVFMNQSIHAQAYSHTWSAEDNLKYQLLRCCSPILDFETGLKLTK